MAGDSPLFNHLKIYIKIMKYTPNKNEIAIITDTPVMKSFDNVDCHLRAVISPLEEDEINGIEKFKVRTDLVSYKSQTVDFTDETEITKQKKITEMQWEEVKQDWSVQEMPISQTDAFASQIAPMIPADTPRSERKRLELLLMFKIKRQQEAPWGVAGNLWREMTENDYYKEEEINV